MDASFSQGKPDNRWNTARFPALYCCCSLAVARAFVRRKLRRIAAEPGELGPGFTPVAVRITWSGHVVDMLSPEGIQAAGFPPAYPDGVTVAQTQAAAERWHGEGLEGVACRSHALWESGFSSWTGAHEPWGEVAIFVEHAATAPTWTGRREDPLR